MKSIVLSLLLILPGSLLAQPYEASLTDAGADLNYPTIEFLTASPAFSLPIAGDLEALAPDTPQAETLRLVVYRSEIYQSLVIETLTTGMEGCCSELLRRQAVDLEAFASHFGFIGEISGFSFVSWSSPRSFRFTYNGKPFHATLVQDSRIRIERGMGANNSFKPNPLHGSA